MSKQKICSCRPTGELYFYQDSKGTPFAQPKKFESVQSRRFNALSIQDHRQNEFSYQQHHLYEIRLHGLKACSKKEVAMMTASEKIDVIYKYQKTQRLLNLSKWKYTSEMVKGTFKRAFPDRLCPWIQKFLNSTNDIQAEDDLLINHAPLKVLGGRENIIKMLIENNLLPNNFYNLKAA